MTSGEETPIEGDDVEEVDGLPVLAEVRAIEPVRPAGPIVVQTAAVAATGFVAGAATFVVLRRHRTRAAARKRRRRAVDALPVVGSRSFLVDVHLLGSRD